MDITSWKILRDRRLKSDCVHHAMLGIARLYTLTLGGQAHRSTSGEPSPIQFGDHLRERL